MWPTISPPVPTLFFTMMLPLNRPATVAFCESMSASTWLCEESTTSPSALIFPLTWPSIRRDPAETSVPSIRAPCPITVTSDPGVSFITTSFGSIGCGCFSSPSPRLNISVASFVSSSVARLDPRVSRRQGFADGLPLLVGQVVGAGSAADPLRITPSVLASVDRRDDHTVMANGLLRDLAEMPLPQSELACGAFQAFDGLGLFLQQDGDPAAAGQSRFSHPASAPPHSSRNEHLDDQDRQDEGQQDQHGEGRIGEVHRSLWGKVDVLGM